MTIEDFRQRFLFAYCRNCAQPTRNLECGRTFSHVFHSIDLPDTLKGTHRICNYCLELYADRYVANHENTCLFKNAQLTLLAAGWSTPTSNEILRTLRSSNRYRVPVTNLLNVMLSSLQCNDAIVVPIPMGNARSTTAWANMVRNAALATAGIRFGDYIQRNKLESTRQSVAEKRKRIVKNEYSCVDEASQHLQNAVVVLVDDNVTSGATMIGCAQLLRDYKPASIIPLTLERQLHPRLLNYIQRPAELMCDAFTAQE